MVKLDNNDNVIIEMAGGAESLEQLFYAIFDLMQIADKNQMHENTINSISFFLSSAMPDYYAMMHGLGNAEIERNKDNQTINSN